MLMLVFTFAFEGYSLIVKRNCEARVKLKMKMQDPPRAASGTRFNISNIIFFIAVQP